MQWYDGENKSSNIQKMRKVARKKMLMRRKEKRNVTQRKEGKVKIEGFGFDVKVQIFG